MKILLPILALTLLAACSPREDQRLACEQSGGVYHTSSDPMADDDVCVYSRDRVQFYENE